MVMPIWNPPGHVPRRGKVPTEGPGGGNWEAGVRRNGAGHRDGGAGGLEKGKEAKPNVAAASYITSTRSGDYRGALRFLSFFVELEGITEAGVCEVFSDFVPLE